MIHPRRFAIAATLLAAAIITIQAQDTPPTSQPSEKPAMIPSSDHPSLSHIRETMAGDDHFTIVALGDSNTEVNWTSRGHLNWVGLLAAGLFESGYVGRNTVVNAGISGDMAAKALGRLERDVLSYDPDLVIITFATNDVREFTPGETEAAMRSIIQRVREAGASILVRTPQPNFAEDGYAKDESLDAIVDAVRRAANEENVALLDHYALWQQPDQPHPPSYYEYNALHPNEHGHRRFYAELAPILGLRETLRWEN